MFNFFPKKPGPYVPKGGAEGQVLSKNSAKDFDTVWTEGGGGGGGATGPQGVFGGDSQPYTYSTTTTDSDPGSGVIRFDNTTLSSATKAYIDLVNSDSVDVTTWIDALDDSSSVIKGTLRVVKKTDQSTFHTFQISAANTTATGYRKLNLTYITGNGSFVDTEEIVVSFTRQGDVGATGPQGDTGAPGAAAGVGGAITIAYTFSTTTADADPGNGKLRLSSATQNLSTVIRADLISSDTTDWTTVLATLGDSTSIVKGHIRLFKSSDPTKWLLFQVTALASPSGYKNISVTNIGSSSASPFVNNDAIFLSFERTGDSFQHRVVNASSSATPTINADVTDFYSIGALSTNITGFTVSGTPVDRQPLWVCIKGAATRTITWGSSFAATTISLPAATVGTTELKVGFIYSSSRAVWECVAVV